LSVAAAVDADGYDPPGARSVAGTGMLARSFLVLAVAVSLFHVVANALGTPLERLLVGAGEATVAAPVLVPLGRWLGDLATLSTLTLCAIHFAGFAILCTLRFPLVAVRSAAAARLVLAVDIAFGLLIAAAALGLAASENAIYARGVVLARHEWVMAAIVILGAIELTRRTTGWIIPLLIVAALTYPTVWGPLIPGVFRFAGLSVQTVTFRSIFSDEGMFGLIAQISATYVFMFILFGAFLVRSGAGAFIVDLARAAAGRFTGGPGFVAVLASGLTGTISGSSIANTVSTGVITIPLMKRSGFPPKFAAGVEAAASTGGQLMPPIMGAGAFVMASYTQIPYLDIVRVAALPAIVFFASVAFFVRVEAKRSGVVGVADGERVTDVLKRGGPSFLIPIAVLVALLVQGFTPTYAAGFAILAVIAASWLTANPMGPRAILEALALGATNMVTTAVLLVAVGLIVNVIAMTGIGNTFSLMIADWAGGNLFVAIVLIALASLVLGMGLPVTAAYIVLATLSAPALRELIVANALSPDAIDAATVAQMVSGTVSEAVKPFFLLADPASLAALAGPMDPAAAAELYGRLPPEVIGEIHRAARASLDPAVLAGALLSAHMIIFWLSQDSNVTPPVCLTAFAAAAIAKTPPMATGMVAWKLSKGLYLLPVMFAYTPFLTGTATEMALLFGVALLGVWGLGAAIEGYFEAPIPWYGRAGLLAGGVALIWPAHPTLNLVAAVVVVALLALNAVAARRAN
jgi:TRAP transporter 4TM/12TM fusion protein